MRRRGFTLIELLCVLGIITVLAALLLAPAARTLQKARADQWSDRAGEDLRMTVGQLRRHFQGSTAFPTVTLDQIASRKLVGPSQLRFLKDRRVRHQAAESRRGTSLAAPAHCPMDVLPAGPGMYNSAQSGRVAITRSQATPHISQAPSM